MYIGLDVGGTNIRGILLKDDKIVKFLKTDNNTENKETILESIDNIINELVSEKEINLVKSINLSIAGQIDCENGILKSSPNLPIKDFSFSKYFLDKYNKASYIDNDVNCAAIAESSLYPSNSSQLFIFLGTGIGGAFINNGSLVRGINNLAFEIGHLHYHKSKELCGCGKVGCYEAWVGAKSAIARYKKIKNIENEKIHMIDIENAYLNGEKEASEVFLDTIEGISMLTNDLITLLNPKYIIFGGGVIEHSNILLTKVKEYIEENIRFEKISNIEFKKAIFKAKSNAYGSIIGYIKSLD